MQYVMLDARDAGRRLTMATMVIRDEEEAATALSETLFHQISDILDDKDNFDSQDDYNFGGYLLGTLICNPILSGKLSDAEVDGLTARFNSWYEQHPDWDHPDLFFFDYKV